MKKIMKGFVFVLVSMLLFGCSSISSNQQQLDIDVSLLVSGSVEKTLETSDFNDMEWTEISITRVSKDVETTIEAKGILLSEVLDYLNVSEFNTIAVIAEDDYSQEYDEEIALDVETMLVFYDGENLIGNEEGPIWLIASNFANNLSIKQLKELVID